MQHHPLIRCSLVYPSLTFLIRDSHLRFETTKEDYLKQLLRGSAGGAADPEDDEEENDAVARVQAAQQETRAVSVAIWLWIFRPCSGAYMHGALSHCYFTPCLNQVWRHAHPPPPPPHSP